MNDYFVSLIRTYVPLGIGGGLAWLALHYGVVVDDQSATWIKLGAAGVTVGVYYAAARAVEHRWPGLGRFLVALSLTGAREPMYPSSSQVRSPQA